MMQYYCKTSNIRHTLVGNKIVDHSDVVGASPVGDAPTTSSFSTQHLASRDSAKTVVRQYENLLTHWGRATHICVSKLTIIALDNGLSPVRRQAIIWTNAGILLIGPLGTNFSEILIRNLNIFIKENAFENVVWKLAILPRPQCVKCWDLVQLILETWRYVIINLQFIHVTG